ERLNELLRTAMYYRASDIYFTIKNKEVSIEIKVKNKLSKIVVAENDINFFRYLQYRANLDVGNASLPQTGQFEVCVDSKRLSLRLASVNAYQLTTGVLRILTHPSSFDLNDLTYSLDVIDYLRKISNYRSGLFVFSGPTGSGKTTALYTILNKMKEKKIFTLEDPIEVFSPNYVQIQVNEKQNMDYGNGIKQLMRHAPDVIMIGEIRDETAAAMAVRCALTGHLVLTSIHSSSCTLAIERLVELGAHRLQLQDVLKGVSNQRLYLKKDKKNKVAIYEKMDRKELIYYFKNQTTSSNFISLQTELGKAIRQNIITYEEAKQDFDE
ncbi:MAG: ATPase, T2SS/T4P/T4SS family, partial [Anaerorhabdus sp.]